MCRAECDPLIRMRSRTVKNFVVDSSPVRQVPLTQIQEITLKFLCAHSTSLPCQTRAPSFPILWLIPIDGCPKSTPIHPPRNQDMHACTHQQRLSYTGHHSCRASLKGRSMRSERCRRHRAPVVHRIARPCHRRRSAQAGRGGCWTRSRCGPRGGPCVPRSLRR